MVRYHHKMGVDTIKVMSTGGFMTTGSAPWHAQFTLEQLRVAVEEAHRVGKPVAAHAHGVEGIRRAVRAGVDTIEHCSFAREDGTHDADPDLVDEIVEAGIVVCPTVNLRLPDLMVSRGPSFVPALVPLLARGVPIVAGTDAGINFTPHHGYVGGLEAMASLGMGIDDVLHAATGRAAAALGLTSVTGALAPGLDADLLAVGGDPRADLAVLRDLRLVLSRGTPFVPDELPSLELDDEAKALRAAMLLAAFPGAAGPSTARSDLPEAACADVH
jgi:imidazolonepropionase-like amidohydrolase